MSDSIPEFLLLYIFSLLPVKIILRFRAVSKSWKFLIDSPLFFHRHFSPQTPRLLLECQRSDELLSLDPHTLPSFRTLRPPIRYAPAFQSFRLVGTLHGVVCFYDNDLLFFLWNPTIRKITALPPLPNFTNSNCGTNPKRVYSSAFSIGPSTKHFKIVLFELMFDASEGAIYSSIKGKWEELPLSQIPKFQPLEECPSLVIGGMAYWSFCSQIDEARFDLVLLSFDLELERFETIPTPPVVVPYTWSTLLCSWQGSLAFVHLDRENNNRLDIYMRQEGSWCPVFSCNITIPMEPGYVGFPFHGVRSRSIGRVLWVQEELDDRGKVVVKKEVETKSIKILITMGEELLWCDAKAGAELISGSVAVKKSGFGGMPNLFLSSEFVTSFIYPYEESRRLQLTGGGAALV